MCKMETSGEGSFDQANTLKSCVPLLCINPFPCSWAWGCSSTPLLPQMQTAGSLICQQVEVLGKQSCHMESKKSVCSHSNRTSVCCLHFLVSLLLGPSLCCLFGYKSWSLVLPVSCSFPEPDVIHFFFPLLPRSFDLSSFCFKLWNTGNAIVELNKHCIMFGDITFRKNGPVHKLIVECIALKKDRLCTYCLLQKTLREFLVLFLFLFFLILFFSLSIFRARVWCVKSQCPWRHYIVQSTCFHLSHFPGCFL